MGTLGGRLLFTVPAAYSYVDLDESLDLDLVLGITIVTILKISRQDGDGCFDICGSGYVPNR